MLARWQRFLFSQFLFFSPFVSARWGRLAAGGHGDSLVIYCSNVKQVESHEGKGYHWWMFIGSLLLLCLTWFVLRGETLGHKLWDFFPTPVHDNRE